VASFAFSPVGRVKRPCFFVSLSGRSVNIFFFCFFFFFFVFSGGGTVPAYLPGANTDWPSHKKERNLCPAYLYSAISAVPFEKSWQGPGPCLRNVSVDEIAGLLFDTAVMMTMTLLAKLVRREFSIRGRNLEFLRLQPGS